MMKTNLKTSSLVPEIVDVFQNKTGMFYFFKNIVIAEINEGIHINFDNSKEAYEVIKSFYKDCDSFGYISNRINDYSTTLLDFEKFHDYFPNLKLFGVVTYNENNLMNTALEKRFCKVQYKKFKSIISAKDWMTDELKRKKFSA